MALKHFQPYYLPSIPNIIFFYFSTLHLKRFLFSHLFEKNPWSLFLPSQPTPFIQECVLWNKPLPEQPTGWPPYCHGKRRDSPYTEEIPHLLIFLSQILFFVFTNKKKFSKILFFFILPFFLFLFLGTEQPWIENNNKIALEKTHSCAFK